MKTAFSALKWGTAIVSCFFLGQICATSLASPLSIHLVKVLEIADLLQEQSLSKIERDTLYEAASQGLIEALEDPYSVYYKAQDFATLNAESQGDVVGLGIELAYRNGQVFILSILENSPASQSQIPAMSRLLEIDAKKIEDLSWAEINQALKGENGSEVTLKIEHQQQLKDYTVTRGALEIPALHFEQIESGLCYVKIPSFLREKLAEEFNLVVAQSEGCESGLILDLQSNPGGYVQEAVELGGALGLNDIVVQINTRINGQQELVPLQTAQSLFGPIIVLINEGSASASEVLTGAFQDNHRAIVMGQRSFGKGLVQSVLPLHSGGGISLTTGIYLTPRGRNLNRTGIVPDIEYKGSELEVKNYAIQYLKENTR